MKLILGGNEYTLPDLLNIGQLEKIADVLDTKQRAPAAIIEIVMSRAEPKVANVRELEATLPELAAALDVILMGAGFKSAPSPTVEG